MKKAPILRCRGTIRWKPRRRRLIPQLFSRVVDPGGCGFFTASFPPLLILFSGLLGLAGADGKADSSERRPVTPINLDLYHTSVRLVGEVNGLVRRHPDKFSMETIRAGNKGYQSEVSIVTYCRDRKEVDDNSKFRILLSFGQHGRELITTELALRILSILSEEESLDDTESDSLNSFLDKLVIKVVPMENLNGRKLVEGGDICERRNGRGVDLNRNWSVDWGKKEKDYDPYEENPGVAPFSEPESQIMRKLAASFNPHMWVNVHSGMEALFMPYDHKNTTPPGLYSVKMKSLLKDVNRLHCHNRCLIGSGGGSVGYLAHGTATDYMYDVVRVPMAFTFEIYGDWEASSGDCFKMFNPIDIDMYNRVINDWSAAFFTIFKVAPKYMDEVSSQVSVSNSNSNASPKKWESIDDYLEGYLMERSSRYGKKLEVIDLGMQEIRTYYRLFLLSFVLLMFMFCSRISKNKSLRHSMSSLSLSSFSSSS